jgi:glycosyltransferase involved in cell wall biosynthesis
VLAGAGPQEKIIKEYISSHGNLRFVGRLSKENLMKEYYKADLGLIQHFPGATQTVTYKLFDLLSCGIPVLNSLDSELNDIVTEQGVGCYNQSGDSEQLASNILTFYNNPEKLSEMKKMAINVTYEMGNTTTVYSKAVELMEKVHSPKSELICE